MNYARIAQLYGMLDDEYKKNPPNQKRISEIELALSKEVVTPSFWSYFTLPDNWKTYITSIIGLLIALNTQFHYVSQDVQNALLAVAIAFGFWAVTSTQTMQFNKIKAHLGMK